MHLRLPRRKRKRKSLNKIKMEDLMRKGGFAPIKKLKLTTEEPPVEIPDFFPKVREL